MVAACHILLCITRKKCRLQLSLCYIVYLRGTYRCDEDTKGVKKTAVNHNQIILVCCIVVMQHVSADTQEAIIRLVKHHRKKLLRKSTSYAIYITIFLYPRIVCWFFLATELKKGKLKPLM